MFTRVFNVMRSNKCGGVVLTVATLLAMVMFTPTISYADESTLTSASTASTASTTWISCAKKGSSKNSKCKFSSGDTDMVTMRYGEDGNYFFISTSGLTSLKCGNWYGNPDDGGNTTNECWYRTDNIFLIPTDDDKWEDCTLDDDKMCTIDDDVTTIIWVRYGGDGNYIYSMAQGGNSFKCNKNNTFLINPNSGGDNTCQITTEGPDTLNDFVTVANEKSTLDFGSTSNILLRFGADNSWTYRIASLDSIKCKSDIFNVNPDSSANEYCQAADIFYATTTSGSWTQIAGCEGDCSDLSSSLTYGTTYTDTTTSSDTWGLTVTASMEAGIELDGESVTASDSISVAYSETDSFQESLASTEAVTTTATCPGGRKILELQLWQFSTDTTQNCLYTTTCSGTTDTQDYACVSNPPSGYAGPQCLPGYCASDDLLCQSCSYDSDTDSKQASASPNNSSGNRK